MIEHFRKQEEFPWRFAGVEGSRSNDMALYDLSGQAR